MEDAQYQVIYLSRVLKQDLSKFSPDILRIVKRSIDQKLMIDPVIFGKPLQHSFKGLRSMRVGNYRVIFFVKQKTITVVLVAHRAQVYQFLKEIDFI